jgi:hypothetical protein
MKIFLQGHILSISGMLLHGQEQVRKKTTLPSLTWWVLQMCDCCEVVKAKLPSWL